jgi:hypothetical protein
VILGSVHGIDLDARHVEVSWLTWTPWTDPHSFRQPRLRAVLRGGTKVRFLVDFFDLGLLSLTMLCESFSSR